MTFFFLHGLIYFSMSCCVAIWTHQYLQILITYVVFFMPIAVSASSGGFIIQYPCVQSTLYWRLFLRNLILPSLSCICAVDNYRICFFLTSGFLTFTTIYISLSRFNFSQKFLSQSTQIFPLVYSSHSLAAVIFVSCKSLLRNGYIYTRI